MDLCCEARTCLQKARSARLAGWRGVVPGVLARHLCMGTALLPAGRLQPVPTKRKGQLMPLICWEDCALTSLQAF